MIRVGNVICHKSVSVGVMDVSVLEIVDCKHSSRVAYLIKGPETGEPDVVCSLEFVKVEE